MRELAITVLLSILALSWSRLAFAKRTAAPSIKPFTYRGLEFRAPNTVETMGWVQAWDKAGKKKLWETRVYTVTLNPDREADVQWRFIVSMKIVRGKLVVTNEDKKQFMVDLPQTLFEN